MAFEEFLLCTLSPLNLDGSTSSAWSLSASPDGKSWNTSSFFLDSSGRSSINLPLQLRCPSREFLNTLVRSKTFDSYKLIRRSRHDEAISGKSDNEDSGATAPSDDKDDGLPRASFRVEAKVTLTFGTGEAISAAVEDVTVHSVTIDENSPAAALLDACVTLRVSRADGERFVAGNSSQRVKTNLEVSGVLFQELVQTSDRSLSSLGLDAASLGHTALLLPQEQGQTTLVRHRHVRLQPPVALLVVISQAMSLSVDCIQGPSLGRTFVSLTFRHSNTHAEPVKVTNVALHPGHSTEILAAAQDNARRHRLPSSQSATSSGVVTSAASTVTSACDMSKAVRWMYAPQCDPNLPIVLRPHEAVSTVLVVDAQNDRRSRTFSSPLSVTAVVGNAAHPSQTFPTAATAGTSPRPFTIVSGSEVTWTSNRAPMEPSDAFRIDMRVTGEDDHQQNDAGLSASSSAGVSSAARSTTRVVRMGSVFCVELKISNLSSDDARDVVVQVKGSDSSATRDSAAVVSEKDGRRFRVGGLTAAKENEVADPDLEGDNKASRSPGGEEAADDVLVVDEAIQVGEIKGHSTRSCRLRFVALREGALRIPPLQIVDRRPGRSGGGGRRYYDAPHHLRVVVVRDGSPSRSSAEQRV